MHSIEAISASIERMAVKAAKVPEGDFRDWDAIDAWADDIASALAS